MKTDPIGQLEVYNYQYDLLSKLPSYGQFNILEVVDEHTLFFQEFSAEALAGYIDLRTGKRIWSANYFVAVRKPPLVNLFNDDLFSDLVQW